VDVEKVHTHIVGHWNYAPGTKKPVYVISSAERVELFLNGKSLGFGEQSSRFLYTFKNVAWQPGTLRAVGYDKEGKQVTEASKTTAGEPAALRLTPRTGPQGLRADGADVALVDVEVVDARGNRCPVALNTINFTTSGPAEWRGGIAQGPDNYILSKSLPVENGVNRVILRSTTKAGRVVLSAAAEGLKPASVEIVSRPVKTEGGLSSEVPGDGLAPYLGRGPTPAGSSFTVSRTPVRVARVSAGANADKAAATFDDDETTEWASDGKVENGWIAYELERPARVSEVVLKLRGWRTQSYPVRVLLDERVVFEGATPRSLGYVTLTFPPAVGRRLKIELTGSASNRDAFGNIIEIPGTPDPQSSAGKGGAKGTLGIIELEIYEPAAPRTVLDSTRGR
jgi:beta-galactosidase